MTDDEMKDEKQLNWHLKDFLHSLQLDASLGRETDATYMRMILIYILKKITKDAK